MNAPKTPVKTSSIFDANFSLEQISNEHDVVVPLREKVKSAKPGSGHSVEVAFR